MSAKGTVLKRVRQSRKANARNKHYKTLVKTVTKKVLTETKKEEANKVEKEIIIIQQRLDLKNLKLDEHGVAFKQKKGNIIWPVERGVLVSEFG